MEKLSDQRQWEVDLTANRKKFLDAMAANNGDIRLEIFSDLYPDSSHFIFELLQNAEDAQATEVSFLLTKDSCQFEHNGHPFTRGDVNSITGFASSTKKDSSDKIGQFGVGFKSVFKYSEAPEIRSGPFAFRITDSFVPEFLQPIKLGSSLTDFFLPFSDYRQPKDSTFTEISAGLCDLTETSLLFVSNIQAIKWKIENGEQGTLRRTLHTDGHVEIRKESSDPIASISHFLSFSETAEEADGGNVSIAFGLDLLKEGEAYQSDKKLVEQFKLVPVTGQVSVLLQCKKETSGLRFHLNAPFVPEISRASIKDTPDNMPLFQRLAKLSVKSLAHIKAEKLLTADFLSVLPNTSDTLGESYVTIREEITKAFSDQPFTPTLHKGHAVASHLLRAKKPLKELLDEEDVNFLAGESGLTLYWAPTVSLSSAAENFLNDLSIRAWGITEFVAKLDTYWYGEMEPWLTKKPVLWMQQLYALLESDPEITLEFQSFERRSIVRLMDGTQASPDECYFPEGTGPQIVPCVDPEILSGGKNKKRQKHAKAFLEKVGVLQIGEPELVDLLLKESYSKREQKWRKSHDVDMQRFIKLFKDPSQTNYSLKEAKIFFGSDEQWHEPEEIFIDSPYGKTGLSEYYKVVEPADHQSSLHKNYKGDKFVTAEIVELAESLGAQKNMPVERAWCYDNASWDYLSLAPGERKTSTSRNRDWIIPSFDALIACKSRDISRLIWCTMEKDESRDVWFKAEYRNSEQRGSRFTTSQLLCQLRDYAWVPQQESKSLTLKPCFVKPSAATADMLPKGFTYEPGADWLQEINFGSDKTIKDEQKDAKRADKIKAEKKKSEAYNTIGVPSERQDFFKGVAELSDENFSKLEEAKRNIVNQQDFPEQESSNSDRRDKGVREEAKDAQPRESVVRARKVRIDTGAAKKSKAYLTHQYTKDVELFCQVCEKPMPFLLGDGTPFFEAVQFLPFEKEHPKNTLALCPNHAAMVKHAFPSKSEMKRILLERSDLESVRIPVTLGQEETEIIFTKMHLADLRSLIHAEGEDEE
jgi:hypothetical protein